MISSLELQNFQSHTHTHADLHPGINVFVGESDVGKSALLRALEWLDTNRPVGDWMQTHDTTQTIVKALVGITSVERYRGDKNLYVVGDKELGAFRTEVPQAVTDALGLSDLNFASQHSPPFMISLSPGQASTYLNGIIKLDRIDCATDWISKKKKAAEAKSKELTERKTKANDTLAHLDWVPEAMRLDKELESVNVQLNSLAGDAAQLTTTLDLYRKASKSIHEMEIELSHSVKVWDEICQLDAGIKKMQTEREGILMIRTRLKPLNEAIRLLVEEISEIPESDICAMCGRTLAVLK